MLDVDSTLVSSEVFEILAESAGTRDEVAAITESAMRGEIDFAESLAPGAQNLVETLHGRDWVVGLVSDGFAEAEGIPV